MTRVIVHAVVLGITLLWAGLSPQRAHAGVDVWTAGTPLVVPVLSLAIDPTSSSRVYAGTSRGLFKTTDGGNTWVARLAAARGAVRAIAVDPTMPTTVYAGAEASMLTVGNTGTVYKSTDSGMSWN